MFVFVREWLHMVTSEMIGRYSYTAVLFLFLGSCMTVGPDYKRPETATPDAWTLEVMADARSAKNGSQLWWEKFGDKTLNKLVARARAANPNIKIARARITTSWHQRGVLAAAFYPKGDLALREDTGLLTYSGDGVDVDPGSSHGQLHQLEYGWELDLFGKIKRQAEAAEGEYEAQIEGWRDATVFITAEVALTYIAYRTLEKRVEVAKEGRANFFKIQSDIEQRLALGVASQLDLAESRGRYENSAANIPQLLEELVVVRNRLAQLVALEPGSMEALLRKKGKIPTPPNSIATGFPGELLRSRPDIRRAERKMAAQTARIGIAEAQLYPELSISGALSYEYLRRGITVDTLNRVLGIGTNLRWRLFHGCADKHRIKENEALLDQAIGAYQQVILNAVTDVENSMTRLHYTRKRHTILTAAKVSQKQAAELMQEAYYAGEVDLLRLLNAQEEYIATHDEEVATQGRRAAHSVRLFRALGGGALAGVPDQNRYPSLAKKGFWSFLKKKKR